ncbi:alpha-hydroxy-acid oxidizing enzyme [Kitasatospora sp. NE20-6]|uniref:alpha-hydroxy acid oxidase n=1 Tax=Kitasatospora sp. NE20-6 TaxID=2859066 RepID=UPI0034DBAB11
MTLTGRTPTMASVDSLAEMERLALAVLPRDRWDFLAGGAGEETTLITNRSALQSVRIVPRVLSGVASADCTEELLGMPSAMPVAIAPMAFQQLFHPAGELAAARAAELAGIPFIASTMSSVPLEEITATGATTWFQLYWLRDRSRTAELVRRAEAAGCTGLVLTVDVPVMARRPRDDRNRFALPDTVHAANLPTVQECGTVAEHTALSIEPALGWSDVEWLRDRTELPIVLKGVLAAEDARIAADTGVDALVVSNHGGRQLDGAITPIDALPAIRKAVAGRCTLFVDSGIRSGLDVLRALALGAHAVLLGRPVLHGLAVGGELGVSHVLGLVRDELRSALLLAGCRDLAAARRLSTVRSAGQ